MLDYENVKNSEGYKSFLEDCSVYVQFMGYETICKAMVNGFLLSEYIRELA